MNLHENIKRIKEVMGHEMRGGATGTSGTSGTSSTTGTKYIDTFKQKLTESENLNISDVRSSFTLDDLKKAFESGRRMSWTDINQEEQEPYYYSFDEWYEEWVNSKK